jgi:hypothetical protein
MPYYRYPHRLSKRALAERDERFKRDSRLDYWGSWADFLEPMEWDFMVTVTYAEAQQPYKATSNLLSYERTLKIWERRMSAEYPLQLYDAAPFVLMPTWDPYLPQNELEHTFPITHAFSGVEQHKSGMNHIHSLVACRGLKNAPDEVKRKCKDMLRESLSIYGRFEEVTVPRVQNDVVEYVTKYVTKALTEWSFI